MMSLKENIRRIAVCFIGEKYFEKIRIIMWILHHDWRRINPVVSTFHEEFCYTKDEEIDSAFPELDPESREHVQHFITRQRDVFIPIEKSWGYFLYNYNLLYSQKELNERKTILYRYDKEQKKYQVDENIHLGGPESLVYHHGLIFSPDSVKKYIQKGVFIDVGGCFGDSALVFLRHYNPSKVITFEPSAQNRAIYKSVMQMNCVDESKFELSEFGLGKECTSFYYMEKQGGGNTLIQTENGENKVEITTLDKFCFDRQISNIKLIKADVEGMGLDMLLGSENTIRRNRPVLNLSIYHNRDELLKIYKTLYEWQLDYHFMIRNLGLAAELTLIAWPEELDQTE